MSAPDKFGEFMVRNLRDRQIEQHMMMQDGKRRAPHILELQRGVAALNSEQRALLLRVVVELLDTAMHDLLHAFQAAHDTEEGIEVVVDGVNVAAESQMLNGEHLGEGGWIDRFSRFRELGSYGRD